jgi:putative intracellular protease/amidase
VTAFDGLLLPGGHTPGMRQYLGSPTLREQVARVWATGRPVGAICHASWSWSWPAPATPPAAARWPKGRPRPPRRVPAGSGHLTARGTAADHTAALVVRDRNYLSACWPGDAYLFTRRFVLLQPTPKYA